MCALRRIPLDGSSSNSKNNTKTIPLGVVRLSLRDVDELIQNLRLVGKGVKLYAGEGVAPRGVEDLDDATKSEMQSLKITVRQPYVTIRLGRQGATFVYKETKAGERVLDTVAELVSRRQSWLPSLRAFRVYFLASLMWMLSNIALDFTPDIRSETVSATLGGLLIILTTTLFVFMAFSGWKLCRQIFKEGMASIRVNLGPPLLQSTKGDLIFPGIIVVAPILLATCGGILVQYLL